MWIDITWAVLVIIGIWRGWRQGLIISIFAVLAWVTGIIGAIKLCTVASQYLERSFNIHSNYLPVISFTLVFIIIAFLIYLIGKMLEKIIEIAQLGSFNKICGVILRVAIYTMLFSIFLWLINEAGFISPATKTQSRTYNFFAALSDFTIQHVSDYFPAVKVIFNDLQQFFENMSHTVQQS